MAFKKFSEAQDSSNLPWANEYCATYPDMVGTCFDIREIKLVPKGAMLFTGVFVGFIFKSAPIYQELVEFCTAWLQEPTGNPKLQVELTTVKPHIAVGFDEDQKGYLSKRESGWYQANLHAGDQNQQERAPRTLPLPSEPKPQEKPRSTTKAQKLAAKLAEIAPTETANSPK